MYMYILKTLLHILLLFVLKIVETFQYILNKKSNAEVASVLYSLE